jgi:hypothetical protein
MDLGPLGGYRLPASFRTAYGVDTAQELADQLGVSRQPTPALAGQADAAYQALRNGDQAPARTLLIDALGIPEENADAALAELPKL